VFGTRAVAYYFAAKIGSRIGGEPPEVQRRAWMAYLSQAGVTVGFVGLTARALPELAGRIESLGLSAVALNLLIGPVAFRLALKGAGEIPEAPPEPEEEKAHRVSSPMLRIPRIT